MHTKPHKGRSKGWARGWPCGWGRIAAVVLAGLPTALLIVLPHSEATAQTLRVQRAPQATGVLGNLQVDRSANSGATPWDYANYGIWDIRIESLERDAAGNFQAVVWVRDAASYRVGLTTDGVSITMFDSDGRSIATASTLYRASVTGTWSQLEAIPETMWMEKGDEIRVRLIFPHSGQFDPVRLRLWSGDRQTFSRTFALD